MEKEPVQVMHLIFKGSRHRIGANGSRIPGSNSLIAESDSRSSMSGSPIAASNSRIRRAPHGRGEQGTIGSEQLTGRWEVPRSGAYKPFGRFFSASLSALFASASASSIVGAVAAFFGAAEAVP